MTDTSRQFTAQSTADDVLQGISLKGKRALVTGGSAGLGYETARALAKAGAEVIIAARDAAKVQEAVHTLREKSGSHAVHGMVVDLSSFASIRDFAAQFTAKYRNLQILVNNAGIMACPLTRTADGFEMQFGTNHLGHFLLTGLLLPVVTAGRAGRVVCLSSGGHKFSAVDFDDINWETRPYEKWQAYGQSKTANALHALGVDRRYRDQGVRAFAVHPGMIITDLARHLGKEDIEAFSSGSKHGELKIKTVEQGAATTVWAATAPELRGKGGLYLEDCSIGVQVEPGEHAHGYYEYALNPRHSDRLWRISEKFVDWKS